MAEPVACFLTHCMWCFRGGGVFLQILLLARYNRAICFDLYHFWVYIVVIKQTPPILKKLIKYLTVYRALLLVMVLPALLLILFRSPYRAGFMVIFIGLLVFTFVIEVLLFAMQFTRRESVFIEVLLLILLIPFFMMLV